MFSPQKYVLYYLANNEQAVSNYHRELLVNPLTNFPDLDTFIKVFGTRTRQVGLGIFTP